MDLKGFFCTSKLITTLGQETSWIFAGLLRIFDMGFRRCEELFADVSGSVKLLKGSRVRGS